MSITATTDGTTFNVTMRRGDTLPVWTFTVTESGSPVDLTGATIIAGWKRRGLNGTIELSKSLGDGIEITDAANGEYTVGDFDMDVAEGGTFDFEIEIELADGERNTDVSGVWTLTQDVV